MSTPPSRLTACSLFPPTGGDTSGPAEPVPRCPGSGLAALVLVLRLLMCLFFGLAGFNATAKEAASAAADPVLEARMVAIAAELRCLVCQNQSIADSHADLAVDLRQQVRELLQQGQTDQQIFNYMTARYGDFVLYRPPFKNTTALLWLAPGLLLLAGLAVLVGVLKRRSKMPADRFEPEPQDAEAADTKAADTKAANPAPSHNGQQPS